jgi:hypothetical protein
MSGIFSRYDEKGSKHPSKLFYWMLAIFLLVSSILIIFFPKEEQNTKGSASEISLAGSPVSNYVVDINVNDPEAFINKLSLPFEQKPNALYHVEIKITPMRR